MIPRPLRPALLAALASLAATAVLVSPASAAASTSLSKIKPASGPELASSTVTLHGKGFSTIPGATEVTFAGQAALSVTCSSSTVCVATTPTDIAEGSVPVIVSSGGSVSAPQMFDFTAYSPPTVDILTSMKGAAQFKKRKLKDFYPAIFDAGNIYLNITNTTSSTVTVTGNFALGSFELPAGENEGLNIPAQSTPYTFTITGSSSPRATLTVQSEK